jgi:Domain of unknown function (DUF5655)/Domain of unknown function (DUF4287)
MINQQQEDESMAATDPYTATDVALLAKTGKSLDAWVEIARKSGIAGHKALVEHLKDTHGLGHGHANSVVHKANNSAAISMDGNALVEAMFAGPRAVLRPIYNRLSDIVSGFDSDIEFAPKKGYVSLRRSRQFAILQPSTKDRFDLGLNLKGSEPTGRLEASGSWNAMVSHRVRIASIDDVDAEVADWLRAAYEAG